MAGNDGAPPNNEILGTDKEEEQGASARGEPHSRVGGILECDPPGNRNPPSENDCADGSGETVIGDDDCDNSGGVRAAITDNGGLCRYAIGTANTAMSFIEVCQVYNTIIGTSASTSGYCQSALYSYLSSSFRLFHDPSRVHALRPLSSFRSRVPSRILIHTKSLALKISLAVPSIAI